MNEREPTVNWFFVHDGKPDGAGYFVGLRAREQSAGRFHRHVRFSLRSRAGSRMDSRARRADELRWSSVVDLFGRRGVGAPTAVRGTCRRAWSMCHPETICDRSTSPHGR